MMTLVARLKGAGLYLLEWIPLVIIVGFLAACFVGLDGVMQRHGFTASRWQTWAVWWAFGLLFAFGWPLRYRAGMKGIWLKSLPSILISSLTGPFAIVLAYPL